MASGANAFRSINIVWWGCIGGVFIYSTLTVLLGGLPLGEGLKGLFSASQATLFLIALVSSLVAVTLPFTLLGRTHLQRTSEAGKVVRSAFLRIALAEVAVILGIAVFVLTGSYEMYIPFFLISTIGLLQLRRELKFYRKILHALQ